MNNEKVLALLGFCRKAGKLTVGTERIKSGGYCLVMLAGDISEKTEKELTFQAQKGRAVVIRLSCTAQEVAHATGTTAGVVTTADEGFCKALLQGGHSI